MEDDLVAVTHECDYPDSVRDKPVLTRSVLSGTRSGAEVDRHIRELVHEGSSIYALDAPLLEALRPDLILTQELCEVCAVSYPIVERAVRRLGSSPQLVSLEPETIEDVFENIRVVGRLAGRSAIADLVSESLRRPGPRLVDSVEIMAGILHPGAVDAPDPSAARRLGPVP